MKPRLVEEVCTISLIILDITCFGCEEAERADGTRTIDILREEGVTPTTVRSNVLRKLSNIVQ